MGAGGGDLRRRRDRGAGGPSRGWSVEGLRPEGELEIARCYGPKTPYAPTLTHQPAVCGVEQTTYQHQPLHRPTRLGRYQQQLLTKLELREGASHGATLHPIAAVSPTNVTCGPSFAHARTLGRVRKTSVKNAERQRSGEGVRQHQATACCWLLAERANLLNPP